MPANGLANSPTSRHAGGASGPAAVPMDLLVNFETGAPGDLITPVNILASIIGNLAGWTANPEAGGNSPLTHSYISGSNLPPLFPVSIGGATYPGSGSRGLDVNMTARAGTAGWEGMQLNSPTAYPEVTIAFPVKLGAINFPTSGDDAANDMVVIYSGKFAVVSHHVPGTLPVGSGGYLRSHGQDSGGLSTFGALIPNDGTTLSSTSLYYITLNASTATGLCTVVVQDSSGNLVGVSQCAAAVSGLTSFIIFQDYLDVWGTAASHTYYDNMAIGFGANAKFPYGPFTMPDPTAVSVSQTAQSTASVVWTSPGITFKVERNAGSGWTTLTSTAGISPYVDNTVADLTTYTYRVTAILGAHNSNAIATGSVSINNSLFPLATDSFAYGSGVNLNTTGNWTIDTGTFLCHTSPQGVFIEGSGPASCGAFWSNGVSWTTDQRSEVTLGTQTDEGFSQALGPAVRMQSPAVSWYEVSSTGSTVKLWKVIAGARTQLQTAAIALVPGNRMSLQVSGSSPVLLSVQLDTGSGWVNQWTNIDPGSAYLTGGAPGIAGVTNFGGDASTLISKWQAFNEP